MFIPSMHAVFAELATGLHGGFAKKIAEAWFVADSNNQKLIEDTWPHLVQKAQYFISTAPATV